MTQYKDDFYKNLLDNISDGVYFVDTNKVITYWNKGAEKITGYSSKEVVGTTCGQNILNHITDCGEHLCTGDCPLKFTLSDGFEREAEIILSHKSGARIPVKIKVSPIYEDNKLIGAVEIFSDNSSAVGAYEMAEKLRKIAFLDELTDMPNKKYMEIKLENLINELDKHGVRFGMITVDVENYRVIQETSGQQRADEVIKVIAKTLNAIMAPYYIIGRFGESSFLVIVPNVNEEDFEEFKNRLRIIVSNCNLGMLRLSPEKEEKINLCFSGDIIKEIDDIQAFFSK